MITEDTHFKALWITKTEKKAFLRTLINRKVADLPPGDLLIRTHYSALNFKDALSATGNKGVTRNYPHTPGIDAAGLVAASNTSTFKEGDKVIVTGFDLGMNTSGGMGEYIRVPAHWAVPLPPGLGLKESMILGTAGLTAGISLYKMEKMGQRPNMGPIVVTGASGGVGSVALGIFAKAGYEVIASSGKNHARELLQTLGAAKVVGREYVSDESGRQLIKPRWSGALDTVGGKTLATLLKGCAAEGSVAACGLVASSGLPTTVFPFILNGVNLLGVDSATFPAPERNEIWSRLSDKWRFPKLEAIATLCSLNEINTHIDRILCSEVVGRVVVEMK